MSKLRKAAEAVLLKWDKDGFVGLNVIDDLRAVLAEPDPIEESLRLAADATLLAGRLMAEKREAMRLLTGASSLIREELGPDWSDHADDIDEFLTRMKGCGE